MHAQNLRPLVLVILLLGVEVAHAGSTVCSVNGARSWGDEIRLYTLCIDAGQMSREAIGSALRHRAYAYFEDGLGEHALEDLAQSLEYDPKASYPYYLRGIIHMNRYQPELAEQDFTAAIERASGFSRAWAYAYRGAIRMDRANCTDVLRDFDEALSLNPRMAIAHASKAWILATCADAQVRNGADAIKAAKRAITFAHDWRGHAALAAGYAEEGQFENAIREAKFAQALLETRDPTSPCREMIREQRASYEAGRVFRSDGYEENQLTATDAMIGALETLRAE